ncbi:chloromuconate cycloisomerase [Salinarchaeum sp. Harcht-Bsk1]|uniref:dipeptide epimerase n=1 Tax=Salinarchaeum sp. Harcht-Bsk1 TaxID=1333523 RepID=UPI00034231F8|nr:dipeptide epimerase [Salinarchaeum sp. Harcht-Bsk1]AGN00189.1 chloromuconate cycloisomerase [Salinarchaeum sp. Harcht-Bsk1]
MTGTPQSVEPSFERIELPLAVPFEISRGSMTTTEVVVVRLDDGERVGIGAASPSAYYGEDPDSVASALPDLLDVVESVGDPLAIQRIELDLRATAPADAAARAAVSIAVHDLAAKRLGVPLYRLWGLDPDAAPSTSFSIGIADPETMAARAAEAVERGFGTLKLKLGTDDDRSRLLGVREAVPEATLRVDGNCAWDRETALDRLDLLETAEVGLLEQPVAADDLDGLRAVTDATSIPVVADESCVVASDVPAVAATCDAIVCKLMKCGGPWAAREQIEAAHAHGLEVMLGCMVESNASIAAGWHLAPLVERVDLDGSLLLAEDPFDGVTLADARPLLREQEGFGTGAGDRS